MSEYVRVWKEVDLKDISSHLIIVGHLSGECSNCRRLGITYQDSNFCPQCKTSFKYIASRTREVAKIKKRRPDLIFIDLGDYKAVMGKKKARELFS